jgi:HD superfamily phosphodiesterase
MTIKQLNSIRRFMQNCILDSNHDFYHLNRVKQNSLKIIKILKVSDMLDVNLLQAICYLHDIIYLKKRTGLYSFILEAMLIKNELKNLLPKFGVNIHDAKTIINACTKHPYSFPFRHLNKGEDLYTRILQDSDTIDFFQEQRIQMSKEKYAKIYILEKYISFLIDKIIQHGQNNLQRYLNFPEVYEKIRIS